VGEGEEGAEHKLGEGDQGALMMLDIEMVVVLRLRLLTGGWLFPIDLLVL
jgi:hypothetical protein